MEQKVKMYSVYSGNIKEIGWEEKEQGVLIVVFNSGDTYEYSPVPKSLFNEFWKAESKGSWFHKKIRSNKKIKYEKID